jgi:uncharacterized protein YjbI with pentapeptide repeats
MSSEVTAAIIAASVSGVTLIGTVAAQIYGIRRTSRDTEKTLEAQGKQLDKTLGEQREQLGKTLEAQGKQLDRTLAEQRTRTLNERFATAAGQLGDDRPPTVRLAGVYAMAGLADDWPKNQQTCVDVLCGYLRMPYEPDPGPDALEPELLAFRASREVRHTVIRVITAHLQPDGKRAAYLQDWRGRRLDFTGAVFDGGSFGGAEFSGGLVNFGGAEFRGGLVSFGGAKFRGGLVNFDRAEFLSGEVSFEGAEVGSDQMSGDLTTDDPMRVGLVSFDNAKFSGGQVSFGAKFRGGLVSFRGAEFSGGQVNFRSAEFSRGPVIFDNAKFLSGGQVSFDGARFLSDGQVSFGGAVFSGGLVSFGGAQFSGGRVDFGLANWSVPPRLPPWHDPPPGVTLPR